MAMKVERKNLFFENVTPLSLVVYKNGQLNHNESFKTIWKHFTHLISFVPGPRHGAAAVRVAGARRRA